MYQNVETAIFNQSNIRDKARMNSCKGKYAGITLELLPNKELGTFLTRKEFQVYIRYRTGLPVLPKESKCVKCNQPQDIFGDHSIVCKNEGHVISRHDLVRNKLGAEAKAAGFGVKMEQRIPSTHSKKKPADLYVDGMIKNKATSIDVTVINTTATGMDNRCNDRR